MYCPRVGLFIHEAKDRQLGICGGVVPTAKRSGHPCVYLALDESEFRPHAMLVCYDKDVKELLIAQRVIYFLLRFFFYLEYTKLSL